MKNRLTACAAFAVSALTLSGCSPDLGERMATAGMNTVMGMGTVFVVLIFIAFIISRFKYVSLLESWLANRGSKKETTSASRTPAAVPDEETDETEEDETDDLALVAVITAALAASLETSPDKLVVRSIRRKNTNHW